MYQIRVQIRFAIRFFYFKNVDFTAFIYIYASVGTKEKAGSYPQKEVRRVTIYYAVSKSYPTAGVSPSLPTIFKAFCNARHR